MTMTTSGIPRSHATSPGSISYSFLDLMGSNVVQVVTSVEYSV